LLFPSVLLVLFAHVGCRAEAPEQAAKPIFFVHIPKTGGTFIEDLFYQAGHRVGRYWRVEDWARIGLDLEPPCSPWHVPPKFRRDFNFNDYTVFAVVRDPRERLLSEAGWELAFHEEHESRREKLLDIEKVISAHYHVSGHKRLRYTFDEDCHYLPQVEYLFDSHGNVVENILRTEFLFEDMMKFAEKYDLSDVRKALEAVGGNHNRTANTATVDAYIESSGSNLVREYYKADYQFFQEHGIPSV